MKVIIIKADLTDVQLKILVAEIKSRTLISVMPKGLYSISTDSEEVELRRRLRLIEDEVDVIKKHLDDDQLFENTIHGCELNTHFNNIGIVLDLASDESLGWELYATKEKEWVGKFTYELVGEQYLVDEATSETLEGNLFDSIDRIAEFATRENFTWRLSGEYIDTLVHRYMLELEKEFPMFNVDDRSGSCYIDKEDSLKTIYCSPFWEGVNGIPISVDIEGDAVYNHLIYYVRPSDLREFDIFKNMYRELVLSLIEQF